MVAQSTPHVHAHAHTSGIQCGGLIPRDQFAKPPHQVEGRIFEEATGEQVTLKGLHRFDVVHPKELFIWAWVQDRLVLVRDH